jgi:hypothetical protein
MAASYLLQTCEFAIYYRNPFKPLRRGIKYTKWRTVARIPSDAGIEAAKAAWRERREGSDPAKIAKFRVLLGRHTVIDHHGRVYERLISENGYMRMRFVEEIEIRKEGK